MFLLSSSHLAFVLLTIALKESLNIKTELHFSQLALQKNNNKRKF